MNMSKAILVRHKGHGRMYPQSNVTDSKCCTAIFLQGKTSHPTGKLIKRQNFLRGGETFHPAGSKQYKAFRKFLKPTRFPRFLPSKAYISSKAC